MFQIEVIVRGPEGVRGMTRVKTDQKGSDSVVARIADNVAADTLLAGIEVADQDEAPAGDK